MTYSMEELIPVVAKLTDKYTGKESSSVTYEKAQQFMNAVLYCIKENDNRKSTELQVKQITAEEAYRQGYDKVIRKVKRTISLYHDITEAFTSYGNRCLEETVIKGMPEFFKWYDARFNPQETILTLDYPVLKDVHKYHGIDAVNLYLHCISLEQIFLNKFMKEYIIAALEQYDADYKDMIDNLCQILLEYVICHVLIGKELKDVYFTEQEIQILNQTLQNTETKKLEERIKVFIKQFVERFYDNNVLLQNYLIIPASEIAVRLKNDAQFNRFAFKN